MSRIKLFIPVLIFIYSFLGATSVSAQEVEVQYLYKRYPLVKPNSKMTQEEARLQQQTVGRYRRTVRYTLLHLGNESIFYKAKNELQEESNTTFYHRHEKDTVYKSFLDNGLSMFCEIAGMAEFEVVDSLHKFKFQLHNEQRQILGYQCFKATIIEEGSLESRWVAWYAPEIPIQNGPLHFGGLPGLILELQNSNHTFAFTAEKINIKPKNTDSDNVPIKRLEFCHPITLKKYHEKERDVFEKIRFGNK